MTEHTKIYIPMIKDIKGMYKKMYNPYELGQKKPACLRVLWYGTQIEIPKEARHGLRRRFFAWLTGTPLPVVKEGYPEWEMWAEVEATPKVAKRLLELSGVKQKSELPWLNNGH